MTKNRKCLCTLVAILVSWVLTLFHHMIWGWKLIFLFIAFSVFFFQANHTKRRRKHQEARRKTKRTTIQLSTCMKGLTRVHFWWHSRPQRETWREILPCPLRLRFLLWDSSWPLNKLLHYVALTYFFPSSPACCFLLGLEVPSLWAHWPHSTLHDLRCEYQARHTAMSMLRSCISYVSNMTRHQNFTMIIIMWRRPV